MKHTIEIETRPYITGGLEHYEHALIILDQVSGLEVSGASLKVLLFSQDVPWCIDCQYPDKAAEAYTKVSDALLEYLARNDPPEMLPMFSATVPCKP